MTGTCSIIAMTQLVTRSKSEAQLTSNEMKRGLMPFGGSREKVFNGAGRNDKVCSRGTSILT